MKREELVLPAEQNRASTTYVLTVLSVLGVFAAVSAVLIAWPALAYLGSKVI